MTASTNLRNSQQNFTRIAQKIVKSWLAKFPADGLGDVATFDGVDALEEPRSDPVRRSISNHLYEEFIGLARD